jgi:hypothetical protein
MNVDTINAVFFPWKSHFPLRAQMQAEPLIHPEGAIGGKTKVGGLVPCPYAAQQRQGSGWRGEQQPASRHALSSDADTYVTTRYAPRRIRHTACVQRRTLSRRRPAGGRAGPQRPNRPRGILGWAKTRRGGFGLLEEAAAAMFSASAVS